MATHKQALRAKPLVLALALALTNDLSAITAGDNDSELSLSASTNPLPHEGKGSELIRQAIRDLTHKSVLASPHRNSSLHSVAALTPVSSCADDGSAGTLRSLIAAAADGDTLDLTACSTITLATGAIHITQNNLTLSGPGATALAIDGARQDRVFVHTGTGTLTLTGLTVRHGSYRITSNDHAPGGCIVSNSNVLLDHSTVSDCFATNDSLYFKLGAGGGIAAVGDVSLDHSVVRDCYASGEGGYGGGIEAYSLTMSQSILSGNIAYGNRTNTSTAAYGGGADVIALTLVNSTVTGNSAKHNLTDGQTSFDMGGGVFAQNSAVITSSTIDNNYSYGYGGGVGVKSDLTVINSTLSGNTAKTHMGGGIHFNGLADLSLNNSTITLNSAKEGGGGIFSRTLPQAVFQSTIVANNSSPTGQFADVVNGAGLALTIAGANNLIGTIDPTISLPVGTLRSDPQLQPLANNGGPTRTHALALGSPAIDVGNNVASLTTDQRGAGYPRVFGRAEDIGAFEVQAAGPSIAVPTVSSWALAGLAALLAGFGWHDRNRRRSS